MFYPSFCDQKFKFAFGALGIFAKFRKFTYDGCLSYFLDRKQSFPAY